MTGAPNPTRPRAPPAPPATCLTSDRGPTLVCSHVRAQATMATGNGMGNGNGGPFHDPATLNSSLTPKLYVYSELCARAGAVLAGLEAQPPHNRLGSLLRWLSSLHDLFEARCCICGSVFPPTVTSAAELLPPTMRTADLRPCHPPCLTGNKVHALAASPIID